MNPLRCHDILPAQVPQPNYRALRRILAAFIGCAVLCLGVCIAMLIHDAGERPQVGRKRLAVGPPLVTPVSAAPALAFGGAWKGTAALIDRGICDFRLEIAEEKPGRFTGYTSFACTIAEPLMSKPHHADLRTEVLSRYTPDAAIFAGVLENGAIRFHAVHRIGADITGCAVSMFAVARFGANQLAAQWQDCGGGAVLLQRQK